MGIVKIFFESGETTLTPDDVVTLTTLTNSLKKAPPAGIVVAGNADSQGSSAANLNVSRKRAESVRDFLVAQGIVLNTIKLVANGDTLPTSPNDTPENRAKNRRVDVISPDGGANSSTSPNQGDQGEPGGSPPALQPAQGEVPLIANQVAVGAGTPWVNPAGILAPPRVGNDVAFFVDGKDYLADLAQKIRAANKFIFITDWAINPFVHLVRSSTPLQAVDTLLSLLQTAVQRGVLVRVMLWDSNKKFQNNHDVEAQLVLEKAGVLVHRHDFDPGRTTLSSHRFTHHQKTAVMDGAAGLVAYIGGVDVTAGRWDTSQHTLVANPNIWVDKIDTDSGGKPYYTGDFYNSDVDPAVLAAGGTTPVRATFPRLPWHDIHARITGPSAFDIQVNFVNRWNFQPTRPPLTQPTAAPPAAAGNMVVQIVRTGARKSLGPTAADPETSILQAYVNAIRLSQHHIYIENQFFTSNFDADSPIHNQVMAELATRIASAIDKKQKFRVKIVIPVHPEGDMDSLGTQETLHWEYRTIVRPKGTRKATNEIAPTSFVGRVLDKLGGNNDANRKKLNQFLGFYNLRNFGTLSNGVTVTEQIYVHAKMMLVDDRIAIIGSANINDRSLIGTKDTELSAIIVDNDTTVIPVDDKNRAVRNFAHNLRLQLWQEHLGLTDPSSILDPVSDATHKIWQDTATNNTAIYEAVFPNVASNNHVDLPAQKKAAAFNPAQAGRLSQIKGHLTLFPLDWLRDEDLETSGLTDDLFTFLESGGNGTADA